MDFKTKRLRKAPKRRPVITKQDPKEPKPPRKSNLNVHLLTMGGGFLLVIVLMLSIYNVVKSLDFSSIVFSFGKTLQTDESGYTNILLVGVGGEGHDGSQLTDTIILASIDYANQTVPMVSIPRDFYIISDDLINQRINSIYYNELDEKTPDESMNTVRGLVADITGKEVQYYVKVDFRGFEKIVDSLGGVDVEVENAIHDPYYPKGETIQFETFSIDEGPQHLDGETALKYARSRKTTSDFDRAKRQQQLLFAIKEKALSLDILTNPNKIKDLYNSVGDSVQTDLDLSEILELGRLAKDFQKDDIFPLVLTDDPTSCGGMVYTPAREYFNGASVLLPAGNTYDYIRMFVDITAGNVNIIRENDEIQILNGTKVPGLAGTTMNVLNRFCFNVVYYGNASNRELPESTIYYEPIDEEGTPPPVLGLIKRLIPVKTQEGVPPEYLVSERRQNATIVIELGADYTDLRIEDPFLNLKYFTAPASSTTTTATTNSDDEDEEETTESSEEGNTEPTETSIEETPAEPASTEPAPAEETPTETTPE